MDNMHYWNQLKTPPKEALKKITGGRLQGMYDVNPQFRYRVMTEVFGVCGIGWKYEVVRLWNEPAPEGQIFAWAEIKVQVKVNNEWGEPIPGIGGSMLIDKEKGGLYANDEAYKMAITDALSVALKMLGVAADVYAGMMDDTKYPTTAQKPTGSPLQSQEKPPVASRDGDKEQVPSRGLTTTKQLAKIHILMNEKGYLKEAVIRHCQIEYGIKESSKELTIDQASALIDLMETNGKLTTKEA